MSMRYVRLCYLFDSHLSPPLQLDNLFESSVWSREYNGSEVVSLSPGSLMVRAHLRLKRPDISAAQKLGSAFLRGLMSRQDHDWLGPFTIDVSSLRFAEVLVDSPSVSTPITSTQESEDESSSSSSGSNDHYHQLNHRDRHHPTQNPSVPHRSVGWGQWGPWSACSPCSPQYDQIRTRQCRLEGGRGLFINSIEPCIQKDGADSAGDMETRSCQCDNSKDELLDDELFPTTPQTTTTAISSLVSPFREHENSDQDVYTKNISENSKYKSIVSFSIVWSICLSRISLTCF